MVTVSITSFTVTSCELEVLDKVFHVFCNVHFSPILLWKCFTVPVLNDMSSPGLISCDALRDRVPFCKLTTTAIFYGTCMNCSGTCC